MPWGDLTSRIYFFVYNLWKYYSFRIRSFVLNRMKKPSFWIKFLLLTTYIKMRQIFNDTHREKLNSVQEFHKVKSWLLLIFSIFLPNSVCNFQSMKTPLELNSLFSNFFRYITWFVVSPDYTRHWTTCKRGLYVKSYCYFETIT